MGKPTIVMSSTFTFHALDSPNLPNYQSNELMDHLQKWNLDQHAQLVKFSFDQPFERFYAEDFIRDFFSDPAVQQQFRVLDSHGEWRAGPGAPSPVSYEQLNTTITNLKFFDRLKSEDLDGGPIVHASGRIGACMEEWEEGICLQDRL